MMNSSNPEVTTQIVTARRGIISDEDFLQIDYAFGYISLIISLVGVITNIINIRTFVMMGLGDGMNITLMGLSTSDLGNTLSGVFMGLSTIVSAIEKRTNMNGLPVHPNVILMFATNAGLMFLQVTCLTTTFIAIARCLCVAMPFKFKDFFTKSRSVFALFVFYLSGLGLFIPVVAHMGVQTKFDQAVNKTRIVLWISPKRQGIKNITLFTQSFLIFLSAFVVGICIVTMARFLIQSVRFRQMATKGNEGSDGGTNKADLKLSGKELQVVQQIIVICLIYTLCTIPLMFIAIYRLEETDFNYGKRLQNIYLTLANVAAVCTTFNSASTMFVYYYFNSKFRAQCFSCAVI